MAMWSSVFPGPIENSAVENEEAVRRGFWRKASAVAARLPFAEDLIAAYYCAFDRKTPLPVRAALLGALAYFVLPADAVPDMIAGLGYTDDAAVLAATLKLFASNITDSHRESARAVLDKLRGK